MARQYVEIEKRQYSWLILTIICAVSAIASFIRGFQFLFIDSEKFIIYEIIFLVLSVLAFSLYPESSEIKKYYMKTERSRVKVEFLRGGRKPVKRKAGVKNGKN